MYCLKLWCITRVFTGPTPIYVMFCSLRTDSFLNYHLYADDTQMFLSFDSSTSDLVFQHVPLPVSVISWMATSGCCDFKLLNQFKSNELLEIAIEVSFCSPYEELSMIVSHEDFCYG